MCSGFLCHACGVIIMALFIVFNLWIGPDFIFLSHVVNF